eukprot:5491888-Prymnesium_polylepis.1
MTAGTIGRAAVDQLDAHRLRCDDGGGPTAAPLGRRRRQAAGGGGRSDRSAQGEHPGAQRQAGQRAGGE